MASRPPREIDPDGPTDSRAHRALAEAMAIAPLGDGTYDVITDTDTVYTVDIDAETCTCPDHRIRDATCKHLHRVHHEIDAGTTPAPGQRLTECPHCDATVPTDETTPDPVYCPTCTLSPGEPVRDRETGDVLIVVESTDHRAAQTGVPGTTHSVAAHPGNERYDPADPIVEAIYPLPAGLTPVAVRQRRPRTYSFPRDRLERVV